MSLRCPFGDQARSVDSAPLFQAPLFRLDGILGRVRTQILYKVDRCGAVAGADPARAGLTVRCAIYTRKSSDEGLEQEFNSLDAQREACEAYIVSQRHAGWVALADMYDDGGLSGGTMERAVNPTR